MLEPLNVICDLIIPAFVSCVDFVPCLVLTFAARKSSASNWSVLMNDVEDRQ